MVNIILGAINFIGLIASIIGLVTIDRQIKRMNKEWIGSRYKIIFYILMAVSGISLLIRVIDWIR
jgi:hypothetical protein